MSIEERINKIISEQLGVKPEKIKPESNLSDDLNADSLDHVELLMAVEAEFGIEISDAEWEAVETVDHVYECGKRHIGEAA